MACGGDCPALILQLLVYGVTNGAVVALNAVGFTLAYAVARQLNLAHGNVFALTTVAVASLARAAGVTAADPLWVRVGLVVGLAAVGALADLAGNRSPFAALAAVTIVVAAVTWRQPTIRPHIARSAPLGRSDW